MAPTLGRRRRPAQDGGRGVTGGPAVKLPLLLALAPAALLTPLPAAVAGPPEAVSGAMAFDEVCEWLRQYRREEDQARRLRWVRKLGATRDPRVAVALMETCLDRANPDDIRLEATLTLKAYYPAPGCSVDRWW